VEKFSEQLKEINTQLNSIHDYQERKDYSNSRYIETIEAEIAFLKTKLVILKEQEKYLSTNA
jgi:hypothetical protein